MKHFILFVLLFCAVSAFAQKNILIGNTTVGDTNAWMFPMVQSQRDNNGHRHYLITAKSKRNGQAGYNISADTSSDGVNWSGKVNLTGNNDPSLAMDSIGHAYIANEAGIVYTSTDFGASWVTAGLPYYAICPSADGADYMRLAIDRTPSHYGNVYLIWTGRWYMNRNYDSCWNVSDLRQWGIFFARSTDYGATWSFPIIISDLPPSYSSIQASDSGGDCYHPDIAVDAEGIIYIEYTAIDLVPTGGQRFINIFTSTDQGADWLQNGYVGIGYGNTGSVVTQSPTPDHSPISLSASPVDSTVLVAYEPYNFDVSGAMSSNDSISMIYTINQCNTWKSCAPIGVGKYPAFPQALVDSANDFIVSYYGSPDGKTWNNLYMDISTNNGFTWSEVIVNDTPFSLAAWQFTNAGECIGAWYNMAITGKDSVGICFSDNRNKTTYYSGTDTTPEVFFANIYTKGVQLRNKFSANYGDSLAYHKAWDTAAADAVPVKSGTIVAFTLDTSYTAHPKSMRYNAFLGIPLNNYELFDWNNSTAADSFSHTFSRTGIFPSVQEADFVKLDSLYASCSLGGANGGNIYWSIGSPIYNDTTPSALAIDSAFESTLTLNTKSYYFKASPTITALGATWSFGRWLTGSNGYVWDTLLSNIKVFGDTSFTAQYTSSNRSADSGMLYNSQRKTCYDSLNSGVMWRVTCSYSDVYLSYSTDNGCTYSTAQRINSSGEYGTSINPSICCAPQLGSGDTTMIYIVYEDSTIVSGTIKREVHYYDFYGKDTAASRYCVTGTIDLPGYSGQPFADANPAAPMVCPVLPDTMTYGKAMCVWSDGTSVCIAMLGPYHSWPCGGAPPPSAVRVPNSAGGLFPAIEPGNHRAPVSDGNDYNLTWHNGNSVHYAYLYTNCSILGSDSSFYAYADTGEVAQNSLHNGNAFASLAAAPSAEPIVSYTDIDTVNYIYNMSGAGRVTVFPVIRNAIVTRMKAEHDSAWGGERIISESEYFAEGTGESMGVLRAPSVTVYPDSQDYKLFYQYSYNGVDSVQWVSAPLTPPANDTSFRTLHDYTIGRSPFQPIIRTGVRSGFFESVLWSKDSLGTHNIRSASSVMTSGCQPQSGAAPAPIHIAYTDAIVNYTDSALIRFTAGEMQYAGNSGAFTIQQKPMNPITPIDSIAGAEKQMQTQYIHIADDTCRISGFYVPMLTDTLQTPRAIGAGMLSFKVELRDSVTDTVVKTLDTISLIASSPYVSGTAGMDTSVVIGHNGQTCFIQISVDTLNAPHTVSVMPAQEVSETQLSTLISDTGGMAKQINPERELGLSTSLINLSTAPNPFYPRSDISFTVPQSESGYPVQVKVFSITGKCVATLVDNAQMQAGRFTVTLDGTNLPTAEYVVRVMEHDYQQNGILVLMK